MVDNKESNVLNKLFDLFRLKLHCDCLGSRDEQDPRLSKGTGNGIQNRSTEATWNPRPDLGPEKDIVDKNYMDSLLQGLKDTYIEGPVDSDAIQIKKKKNLKSASPRWNNQLSQMLSQAVNLYGSNIELIHAFFPGFKKEFITRKVKKCLKALSKKMAWTHEEDEKLLKLVHSDNIDISTVLKEFPARNLSAVIERAAFLKNRKDTGLSNGQETGAHTGTAGSVEEEYDFSRMLTGTNSDDFSISGDNGLASEADEADFAFNPAEAGFSFTFDHDLHYGTMDLEHTNHLAVKVDASAMVEDLPITFKRLPNLERVRDNDGKSPLNIYASQIDYLFPEKGCSFGELVDERALRVERSITDSLLDLTVSNRQHHNMEENSPTAAIRVGQLNQHGSSSFAEDYLNI